MNLTLDHYADNPIIDELVFWPPKPRKIKSVRASAVLFRKPFIEVEFDGGETFHRQFTRESFARYWAEACVILETLTTIELISEFSFEPLADRENYVKTLISTRDYCIRESNLMFAQGLHAQFLMQYGEDCKNLPQDCRQKIAQARRALAIEP